MREIERAILAECHIESQTLKELCRSTQYPCRVVKESIDKLIAKKLVRKTWGWRNGSGKKVIVYAGIPGILDGTEVPALVNRTRQFKSSKNHL
jgi:hypothetical protein